MTENNSFDPKWPGTHFLPRSTWLDSYWLGGLGFDPKTAWNSFFTLVDIVWPVLTRWTRFWPKMMILTRKRPETHFLPWSTWFDPYLLDGLGFDRKWRFWPETAWNSFFTLVDMFWPVLTRWTRFWPKITVLTRKLIFYLADMVWPVLTRWNRFLWKDAVDSRKIYFWIFPFLNFFGFLLIIIKIK
jgi:hypothetical protein